MPPIGARADRIRYGPVTSTLSNPALSTPLPTVEAQTGGKRLSKNFKQMRAIIMHKMIGELVQNNYLHNMIMPAKWRLFTKIIDTVGFISVIS